MWRESPGTHHWTGTDSGEHHAPYAWVENTEDLHRTLGRMLRCQVTGKCRLVREQHGGWSHLAQADGRGGAGKAGDGIAAEPVELGGHAGGGPPMAPRQAWGCQRRLARRSLAQIQQILHITSPPLFVRASSRSAHRWPQTHALFNRIDSDPGAFSEAVQAPSHHDNMRLNCIHVKILDTIPSV